MDFGVGFLSNNIMLPFLDFFYGIVPNYGLAIIALTLVVRFVLFPVSANQLRSMRRMKIANPVMQQRIKEVQERYKSDPAKQQEELAKVNSANFKEFGNPLSGCLPAIIQLPILFALFATLRGSPFADINYSLNFQIATPENAAQIQHQPFTSPSQNVYFADRVHFPVLATAVNGTNIAIGEQSKIVLQTSQGKDFNALATEYPDVELTTRWKVTKGQDLVEVLEDGTVIAKQAGDVTVQATVPGLASNKGFLFIKALGKTGVTNADGSINWDIVIMVLGFGISLYANQNISSGSTPKPSNPSPETSQQDTMNKLTPIIFSGMFLFFPLPSGVMLYMLIANIFQTLQAFIVAKEPLPENLQKLVAVSANSAPTAKATKADSKSTVSSKSEPTKTVEAKNKQTVVVDDKDKDTKSPTKSALPFEPNSSNKKKKKGS
ncbi:membrane protein insertase YidC [Pseudanabaena galeata UHCC 0370]|jgi:YidC/Oxa1 family membrane protein insertase|uniref:Membrane protein insertase YidC n=1 Tax=Pseudanabaena galeata UHCC 0370 TaxID=3110310 RepID=A0ABU5TME8_9CYAN|nr:MULTISPECIES: membrane protein insertase YidC [Pseudanabaena]MEA5479385.1 membrane protein insertase YidC [Pseudanabaena galeata UHCC 0370]MEA5486523.1 membrane protein insertase YidC [Pseudanabaena sp. CCNP1317]WGS74208.1 membrane protein insertase YidC [Pseudanabaena galeata CCNP1313]